MVWILRDVARPPDKAVQTMYLYGATKTAAKKRVPLGGFKGSQYCGSIVTTP